MVIVYNLGMLQEYILKRDNSDNYYQLKYLIQLNILVIIYLLIA